MQGSDQRLSWDLTVILIEVPSEPGVYSIWRDDTCLYVGETRDLLSRLVLHYRRAARTLVGQHPTWFGFEAYHGWDRTARRDALIATPKPSLNSGAD